MKNKILILLVALLSTLLIASPVLANIGVGVGTGKIIVDEALRPGMQYDMPPLTVLNTGDEASDYAVSIAYHQDQPELEPSLDWFTFKPDGFHLEPGGTQVVEVRLNLPVKVDPGDYFAYLEGFPVASEEVGGANISIAAAAKMYFTIEPGTVLGAIVYKISSFWNEYRPWTDIAAGALLLYLVVNYLKDRVDIDFKIKKKSSPKGSSSGKKGSDESKDKSSR